MRNLKRALSLALASVMLLGMMVVGTSASFNDVGPEHNTEAIAVAEMLELMVGSGDGNFLPDKTVTREEMAGILAKLLLLDVDHFNGVSNFTDVAPGQWYAPAIAACAADGFFAGIGGGQFGLGTEMTVNQVGLLLCKVLGYFQTAGDYGEDADLAATLQASKAGLFSGLDKASKDAPITRNQLAQMCLNALKATKVEKKSGTGVTVSGNGITVTTGAAEYVELEMKGKEYAAMNDLEVTDDETLYTVELGEDVYGGKLTVEKGGNDDLGRPATVWTYDTDSETKVVKAAEEAKYTFTLTGDHHEDSTKAKVNDILQDKTKNKKLTVVDSGTETNYSVNGTESTLATVFADTMKETGGSRAVKVEVYTDGNNVTDLVVLNYTLGQITAVSTKLKDSEKEDGAAAKLTVGGKGVLDIDFEGYDADTYVEDAYILYILGEEDSTDVVLDSMLPQTVEGKITATRGDKSAEVRIDGKYYKNLTGKELANKTDGTFYLDIGGQIGAYEAEVTKSSNYALIYALLESTEENKPTDDGFTEESAKTLTAYVVLPDGTKASYEVDSNPDSLTKFDAADDGTDAKLVAYSIDDDGKMDIKKAEDAVGNIEEIATASIGEKAATVTTANNASRKASAVSGTEFIFVKIDKTGKKVSTSTATGYKNVEISEKKAFVVYDDSDVLDYVFVIGEDTTSTEEKSIAVVTNANISTALNEDDKDEYSITIYMDGEEQELSFGTTDPSTDLKKLNGSAGLKKGDVISFTLNTKGIADASDVAVVTEKTVAAVNDEYFSTDDAQVNLADVTLYTIELDDEDKFDSVSESGTIDAKDKVYFVGDEPTVVFVKDVEAE